MLHERVVATLPLKPSNWGTISFTSNQNYPFEQSLKKRKIYK